MFLSTSAKCKNFSLTTFCGQENQEVLFKKNSWAKLSRKGGEQMRVNQKDNFFAFPLQKTVLFWQQSLGLFAQRVSINWKVYFQLYCIQRIKDMADMIGDQIYICLKLSPIPKHALRQMRITVCNPFTNYSPPVCISTSPFSGINRFSKIITYIFFQKN